MSMIDKRSPRHDSFDMGQKFRSRHPRPSGWLQLEKRLARRASRHGGSHRAIEEGLKEARESIWVDPTLYIFALALWRRGEAEKISAAQSYYASFGEATAYSWQECLEWADENLEALSR
jgi:hypothetical protein